MPPTLLVAPDNEATFSLPPTFQLGADAGREEVPPAGRDRADVRLAAGRHHDGLDGIHRPEDVSGRQDAVLARAGQDENNNGLTWSETEDVRDRPREADARPRDADSRRCEPARPALVPGSRRRLLQPPDPRAQRHDAEHVHGLSRPRRRPSRRSPARESSPGRSERTSRKHRRYDPRPLVGRRRITRTRSRSPRTRCRARARTASS